MSNIYLDLDETLIHAIPGRPGMGNGRRIVNAGIKANGRPDTYHTALRPSAEQIVAECKAIAPTTILTTGTREYALAQIKEFSLPFEPHEIIAREDYLYDAQTAYGHIDTFLLSLNKDKTAVLIDNLEITTKSGQAKQRFLGIPESNYFVIREYIGGKDPEKFMKELADMFENIKKVLSRENQKGNPIKKPCNTAPAMEML